jgi:predicted transcriptional regulator
MMSGMTRKLQEVLKEAETWPEEAQEELADAALEIAAGLKGEYHATDEELPGIDRGLDDARQGRFATDEEVKGAFGKFRRA